MRAGSRIGYARQCRGVAVWEESNTERARNRRSGGPSPSGMAFPSRLPDPTPTVRLGLEGISKRVVVVVVVVC